MRYSHIARNHGGKQKTPANRERFLHLAPTGFEPVLLP